MSRRYTSEADLGAGLAGVVLVVALLMLVAVATLVYLTVTELWRIYRDRATGTTEASRLLWGALAGLLGVFAFAGFLSLTTHNAGIGLLVAALGFFLYVLVCEYIDWLARRKEVPLVIPETLALDAVVSWQPSTETAVHSMNGRSNTG